MNEMERMPCYTAERQSLVVSNIDSYFGGLGLKSRPETGYPDRGFSGRFRRVSGEKVKSDCHALCTVSASVRPAARNNSASMGRIFVKFHIGNL